MHVDYPFTCHTRGDHRAREIIAGQIFDAVAAATECFCARRRRRRERKTPDVHFRLQTAREYAAHICGNHDSKPGMRCAGLPQRHQGVGVAVRLPIQAINYIVIVIVQLCKRIHREVQVSRFQTMLVRTDVSPPCTLYFTPLLFFAGFATALPRFLFPFSEEIDVPDSAAAVSNSCPRILNPGPAAWLPWSGCPCHSHRTWRIHVSSHCTRAPHSCDNLSLYIHPTTPHMRACTHTHIQKNIAKQHTVRREIERDEWTQGKVLGR